MLQGIVLFFVGIGALLVSIVSLVSMAWLAVVVPLAIAATAALGVYFLARRRSRRASRLDDRERDHRGKSPRIAA